MNEQLVKILVDVAVSLSPLLIAGLSAVSAFLAKYINEHCKNKMLATALTKLDVIVFTVVKELEQTIVSKLKDASQDGKLTDEEIRLIKDSVLDKLKNYVNLGEIMRLFNLQSEDAAQKFVESKIEAAVHDLKQEKIINNPLP